MSLGREVRVALISIVTAAAMLPVAQAASAQAATCGSTGIESAGRCLYTTVGTDTFSAPPYRPFVTFTTYGGSTIAWGEELSWGGMSEGTLAVSAGDVFQINVGGTPTDNGDGDQNVIGGFNGGGDSGIVSSPPLTCCSQGGAGASDVRDGSFTLTDRLIVAGGAGGRGRYLTLSGDHTKGGEGGGEEGGGGASTSDGDGGGGGTQSGAGASPGNASSAGFGFGGDGGPGFADVFAPGAGGGGGYYGGGGSGTVCGSCTPGAGGGGSGYITPEATNPSGLTGGAFARSSKTGTWSLDGAVMATWPSDPLTATVTLTADKTSPVDPNTVVTFTADVAISTGALAQGRIVLTDYADAAGNCPCTNLAEGALEATDDGHMRFTVKKNSSDLPSASNTIVATYEDTYEAIPDTKSSALSFGVNRVAQSINFTSTAPTDARAGGSTYTVAASATSGLPVSFSIAPQAASVCSISGTTVSFTAAGTCTILAEQAGNGTYLAAPLAFQEVTVAPALSQEITFTSTAPTDARIGDHYTVSATGGASGQPVTFSVSGSCTLEGTDTVVFTDYDLCTIKADQAAGNGYPAAPQAKQFVTVGGKPQTVTFDSTAPTDPKIGDTYAVSAHADSGKLVSLFLNATSAGCSLTGQQSSQIGGNLVTAATVTFTGAGTCLVDAIQPGDGIYVRAEAQQSMTVAEKLSQTISFTAPTGITYGDADFDPGATASSGLAVTYTSFSTDVCNIVAGKVHILDASVCVLHADQPGNDAYKPAQTVSAVFRIARAPQTIDFAAPSGVTFGDPDLDLGATASSGLPVHYTSTTTGVCTMVDGKLHLVAPGSCSIDAWQDGDRHYLPAPGVERTFTIATPKAGQTITFAAPSGLKYGDSDSSLGGAASSGLPVSYASTTPGVCSIVEGKLHVLAAGTCTIDADQAGDDAYKPADRVERSFTIGQAPLLITAPDVSVDYGATPVVGEPSYDSFVAEDTADSLTTSPTCSASTDSTTPAGTYPGAVSCSGAVDPNYEITYASGTVTVNRLDSSISINNLPSEATAGGSFTPIYEKTGDGTETVSSSTPQTCAVDSGVVHFIDGGECSLQAAISEGTNYKAATGPVQTFAIAPAPDPTEPTDPGGPDGGSLGGATTGATADRCKALAAKLKRQGDRLLTAGSPRKESLIKRHRAGTLRRLARLGC